MSTIVRYNPDYPLLDFRREMNRLFDDALWRMDASLDPLDTSALAWPYGEVGFNWPFSMMVAGDNLAVDMVETPETIVVTANLPGIKPEDVKVEERDGWLSIRAESKEEQQRDEFGWHIQERRRGLWQRTLRLPVAVKGSKAKSHLENGIFTVELPKVETGKSQINRIPVKWPKLKLPKLGKTKKETLDKAA